MEYKNGLKEWAEGLVNLSSIKTEGTMNLTELSVDQLAENRQLAYVAIRDGQTAVIPVLSKIGRALNAVLDVYEACASERDQAVRERDEAIKDAEEWASKFWQAEAEARRLRELLTRILVEGNIMSADVLGRNEEWWIDHEFEMTADEMKLIRELIGNE